jgi:hypothetical protein
MKMRFHLDEHVPWAIAAGLRQHGVDVTTTRDAGLEGKDDDDHLAFAIADDRVTVTHDDDFLALHAAGSQHAGIAYCHQEKYPVGELCDDCSCCTRSIRRRKCADESNFFRGWPAGIAGARSDH